MNCIFSFRNIVTNNRYAIPADWVFFISEKLVKGPRISKQHDDISVWLKMVKYLFELASDLYIASVYVVPEISVHLCHDAFDMLREDLCSFPPHSGFLICGDYNAHTNVPPDYLDEYICGNDADMPILESSCNTRSTLLRTIGSWTDFPEIKSRANKHGVNILEFCQTIGQWMINGRLGSDKGIGAFTRVDNTGCSNADYMLCNPELFSQITYFKVEQNVPESDHCGLAIAVKGKTPIESNALDNESYWTCRTKYLRSAGDLQNLQVVMTEIQSLEDRNQALINALVELDDTNTVASHFSHNVTQAVDRVCRISTSTNRAKNNGAPWFDKESR